MPATSIAALRYPAGSAAPNVPQDIQNLATDLDRKVVPQFATIAARDAAYSAFVSAGGTIVNGMTCWVESPGTYYERRDGAWVPRAGVSYNTVAIDGTAVPSTARIVRLRKSVVLNTSTSAGAFNVSFGHTFTKLIAVALWPGDNANGLAMITPVLGNHTVTAAHGVARNATGTALAADLQIRVEIDVVGYNL